MNCLVTGASGFIGSWLVRKLKNEGHKVRVLCRKSSQFPLIKDLDFEKAFGDVTQPQTLSEAFKNIDTVFHLAGYIGYKKKDRPIMQSVNVDGTKNVFHFSQSHKIKTFVFLSSVTTIGAGFNPLQILNEDSPYLLSPYSFGYAETKREAENYVLKTESDMKVFAINPSTVYGPGDMLKNSRKNQLKVMEGKLIAYPRGGVSIVGIHDVVDTLYKSVELARHGERYILSGENLFIKDLLFKIAEISQSSPPRFQIPRSLLNTLGFIGDYLLQGWPLDSETARIIQLFHWYENTKAKKELDFQPQSTEKVLESSVAWAKKHLFT